MRRFLARLWLPRREREVALAVVLTIAAVSFMTLAMVRSGTPDRPTQTAIRKPL
jgi:hypothetical protein